MEPSSSAQAAAAGQQASNNNHSAAMQQQEDILGETKDDEADDSIAEGKNADFAAIPSLKGGNAASNLNK